MEIWHLWTSLLAQGLAFLSTQFGLSEALAVIALTAAARLALMPLSLRTALQAEAKKQKIKALKPELDALKEQHKQDPSKLAAATMALYRERGISLMDRLMLTNAVTQSVFGIGLYQVLSKAGLSSRFLWIGSLAKPDVWLTVLVSVLMLLGMALMPGATSEPSMLIVMSVSLLMAVVMIATLPSAVGLYWATSNGVTLAQTLALRGLLRRQQCVA